MKINKSLKTTGLITVLAMCILIVVACSKEGDSTSPMASSSERADQASAPAQRATLQEDAAEGINQATPQEQPADVIEQAAETATSALETPIEDNMEISGTVLSTQSGYVLFADTTQYQVLGKNLSDYVDKNVKITGTLEELGEKQYIHVSTVELIDGQAE